MSSKNNPLNPGIVLLSVMMYQAVDQIKMCYRIPLLISEENVLLIPYSLSPLSFHYSGCARDGLPPPRLLPPGGSALGGVTCVPGSGLQRPQAGF